MAAFGDIYNQTIYTNTTGGNHQTFYWPQQRPVIVSPQPSDWERAAVKAEPADEFTWLRKRVREIEDMAFAEAGR